MSGSTEAPIVHDPGRLTSVPLSTRQKVLTQVGGMLACGVETSGRPEFVPSSTAPPECTSPETTTTPCTPASAANSADRSLEKCPQASQVFIVGLRGTG